MALQLQNIIFERFGGGNWNDQATQLIARSHVPFQGGFSQRFPVESPNLLNIDYDPQGIMKRRGSAASDDISGLLPASDSVIGGVEFVTAGGARIEIIVTVKTIFTNQSGSFAQINTSGSSAYTHAADVSKCSFAQTDGLLFIGIDGANKIQVYKTGADLDPELDNGNTYEEAIGGGTQTVTGTWGTGYYIVFTIHGRLVISKGDHIAEFTDIDQPWDLAGGGNKPLPARIVAATSFVPHGGDSNRPLAVFFTENGIVYLEGFMAFDQVYVVSGSGVPVSYRSYVATNDWLMYLTEKSTIEATNINRTIDVGRRLKANDGVTGPMDTFDPTNGNHANRTFGVRLKGGEQATWFYPDQTRTTISHAIINDLQLGEPVTGETEDAFERRLRHLLWSIKDPGTNPWFVHAWTIQGGVRGILATGASYTIDSGLNDLDTIPIEEFWESPEFDAGLPGNGKFFTRNSITSKPVGTWSLFIDPFLNRSKSPLMNWSFAQIEPGTAVYDTDVYDTGVYSSGGTVEGHQYLDLFGRSLRIRIRNQETDHDWIVASVEQEYSVGRRI